MSDYVRKTWATGETIMATDLNHMEQGIDNAHAEIDSKANSSDVYNKTEVNNLLSQITGGGGGDMYRSTYDIDGDGVVDRAEVADSVQWANVQGRPSIPTQTSQLTNDSGFITGSHTHPSNQVSGLSTVATSGNYNDLSNRPTIPQINDVTASTATVYSSSRIDNLISGIGGGSITFVALTAGEAVTIENATDTVAPNNVTNLTTSNVTQTTLTLSWIASTSSDVVSYDVYNGSTLLGNTASTTYNVTGLTAGTQYTFRVRARDAVGNIASGATINVTTSATVDITAPTVTASPVAGTYTSSQTVTLTANETATIYYTTNGTTPTTSSTVYTSPIMVSATTTLQFFARDVAGNSSSVQSQVYTINSTPTELLVNGNFSSGSTGWELHSNASISNGVMTLNATGGYQNTSQTVTGILPNTSYTIRGNIVGASAVIVVEEQTATGGWIGNAPCSPGNISYAITSATFTTRADTARLNIYLTSTATGTSTFDNISLMRT